MASQSIVEDFTGSGTLASTSPGDLTGVSASWATYSSGGTPNNAFTRSSGGATVVLPLASFARLDLTTLEHTSGVTTVQATIRPGMQMRVAFDMDESLISLSINPDGSGAWVFEGPTSTGSGTFTGSAVSDPVTIRVEFTSTQTRYYVDDTLKATKTAGMYYGIVATSIRFGQLGTFSNGTSDGVTVAALYELQVLTETTTGPLGPSGPSFSVSAPGPLQAPAVRLGVGRFAQIAVPGPLGAAAVHIDHDFTGQLEAVGAVEFYVCDLVDEAGTIRVPISSWQGTLQLDGSSYLQAVIPAAADVAATINGLADGAVFVISRCARLPDGDVVVNEMARSPIEERQFDQGPQRFTCTLSGYSGAMTAPEGDGPPLRILQGLRSVSSGTSGVRVRCAIDWFLRPGASAVAGEVALIPDWISYYVGGGDAYMDAGERA